MEMATEKTMEKLFNYGVLGIFVILLIISLVIVIRHFTRRQGDWEKKSDEKSKDQLDLTLKFVEAVNEFKEAQKETSRVVGEFRISQAAHTEVLRDLKGLIHHQNVSI